MKGTSIRDLQPESAEFHGRTAIVNGTVVCSDSRSRVDILIKDGEIAALGSRLGHSSIKVTMDIYSSVLPGMQREAVDRLAALIGR